MQITLNYVKFTFLFNTICNCANFNSVTYFQQLSDVQKVLQLGLVNVYFPGIHKIQQTLQNPKRYVPHEQNGMLMRADAAQHFFEIGAARRQNQLQTDTNTNSATKQRVTTNPVTLQRLALSHQGDIHVLLLEQQRRETVLHVLVVAVPSQAHLFVNWRRRGRLHDRRLQLLPRHLQLSGRKGLRLQHRLRVLRQLRRLFQSLVQRHRICNKKIQGVSACVNIKY